MFFCILEESLLCGGANTQAGALVVVYVLVCFFVGSERGKCGVPRRDGYVLGWVMCRADEFL